MAGSTLGNIFKITTWGESHGQGLGVVIDGCPAGLFIHEDIIQLYLDRRKPGQTKYATSRKENDTVKILSGTFNNFTTGTPISLMIENKNQRSLDYSEIAGYYRPGHADYTYDMKYGNRDYRGGGRSSGRETIGRVAAGAIACELLRELRIDICAYTKSIGPIQIDYSKAARENISSNPLYMPDIDASKSASDFLNKVMQQNDSAGGIIECIIKGVPAGIGEPVFEKLDACLAKAIMSIGAVKGFEIGTGFQTASTSGFHNNDSFKHASDGKIVKTSNHAGGILGGISDGSEIIFRAAIKPTPSISKEQQTIDIFGNDVNISIKGRHDPIIVPRAVVVVESMAAITIADLMLLNMSSRVDKIKNFYMEKR